MATNEATTTKAPKKKKRKYTRKQKLTGAAAHGLKPGVYVAKVERVGESFSFTFMKIQA